MIIRDAVYDDIDNIAKLYISNWKETYKGLLSEDYLNGLTKEYAVEKWSKYLKNEEKHYFAGCTWSWENIYCQETCLFNYRCKKS